MSGCNLDQAIVVTASRRKSVAMPSDSTIRHDPRFQDLLRMSLESQTNL